MIISLRLMAALAGAHLFLLVGCSQKNAPGDAATAPDPVSAAQPTSVQPLTNMVLIEPGNFVRLNQPITITREFWLGKTEVTQREFAALMGRNPSYFANQPDNPVEKVSHLDAVSYCVALTLRERNAGRIPPDHEYRLPSEAEWEYACRAGSTNRFSFGNAEADADRYAWTAENSDGQPHPVAQKQPNAWGLYDMHGNVWEWCQDWFAEYPAQPQQDPAGPPAGKFKVFRGGGWDRDAKFARASNRFMMAPANGINFVGFRVALSKRAGGAGAIR